MTQHKKKIKDVKKVRGSSSGMLEEVTIHRVQGWTLTLDPETEENMVIVSP